MQLLYLITTCWLVKRNVLSLIEPIKEDVRYVLYTDWKYSCHLIGGCLNFWWKYSDYFPDDSRKGKNINLSSQFPICPGMTSYQSGYVGAFCHLNFNWSYDHDPSNCLQRNHCTEIASACTYLSSSCTLAQKASMLFYWSCHWPEFFATLHVSHPRSEHWDSTYNKIAKIWRYRIWLITISVINIFNRYICLEYFKMDQLSHKIKIDFLLNGCSSSSILMQNFLKSDISFLRYANFIEDVITVWWKVDFKKKALKIWESVLVFWQCRGQFLY